MLKTTIINPQVLKWCMLLGIACLNNASFCPELVGTSWLHLRLGGAKLFHLVSLPNVLQRLQQLHRNICGPVDFHLPKTCVRNRRGVQTQKKLRLQTIQIWHLWGTVTWPSCWWTNISFSLHSLQIASFAMEKIHFCSWMADSFHDNRLRTTSVKKEALLNVGSGLLAKRLVWK